MEISLNQKEIEKSLINYVKAQGVDTSGKDVKVTFTPGRKQNSHSAIVSISNPIESEIPSGPIPRENEQSGPLFNSGNGEHANQDS